MKLDDPNQAPSVAAEVDRILGPKLAATTWIERGIRVLIIILLAWGLTRLFRQLLGRLRHHAATTLDKRGGASQLELEKRSVTVSTVLTKVVSTLVWLFSSASCRTSSSATFACHV